VPVHFCRFAGICQAASRVFIFDYGGTLLHKEKYDIYIKRQTLSAIAGRKPSGECSACSHTFQCSTRCAHSPLSVRTYFVVAQRT
jgi:hypothetical protein